MPRMIGNVLVLPTDDFVPPPPLTKTQGYGNLKGYKLTPDNTAPQGGTVNENVNV
jgi:hypothetical protein